MYIVIDDDKSPGPASGAGYRNRAWRGLALSKNLLSHQMYAPLERIDIRAIDSVFEATMI
jgi:hypothetical protein